MNNVAVEDLDASLEKSSLKNGDIVTLEYEEKTFCRFIDLESSSPSKSPPAGKSSPSASVCKEEPLPLQTSTVESQSPKRGRTEMATTELKKAKTRLVEKKGGIRAG